MTTDRIEFVTPNASADGAPNRPARLARRQRVAAAIASGLVSGIVLGSVVWAMATPVDAPVVIAGEGSATSVLCWKYVA